MLKIPGLFITEKCEVGADDGIGTICKFNKIMKLFECTYLLVNLV
jgi:hypothetical protein